MNEKKTAKKSKSSWLEAALEALAEGGIEAVRVELLARRLGVTKGSFYWHFKDRPQLLRELLKYWTEISTDAVLKNAQYPSEPIKRIYSVAGDIVKRELARMDPHIRAWTQYDESAAKTVAAVDKARLKFLCELFLNAGFDQEQADLRSRFLYYYLIGEHFTSVKEPLNLRIERMETKLNLLLSR